MLLLSRCVAMKLQCLQLVALSLLLLLPSLSLHRMRDMRATGVAGRMTTVGQMAWLVAQFHGNLAGVRSSVGPRRTLRKVGWGSGMPQTRPAGAVGAGCRSISDLII